MHEAYEWVCIVRALLDAAHTRDIFAVHQLLDIAVGSNYLTSDGKLTQLMVHIAR